jgi:predicted O-methyltransferase YrrM
MFTQNWTTHLTDSINKSYTEVPIRMMVCLEVGSFEGRGALMIEKILCQHDASRVYCVDPWEDLYVKGDNRFNSIDKLFAGQYDRFLQNTKGSSKIVPLRGKSDDMIKTVPGEIDFAYIDGDHSPEQVYKDGVNTMVKMKSGGVMVFDDYLWEHNGVRCKDGIDRFLQEFQGKYSLVAKDYHVILRVN